jgi:hypothetical protein
MNQIDVQTGVMSNSVGTMRVVFGLCGSGWVPEIGPMRLENAGAGTYLLTSMLV